MTEIGTYTDFAQINIGGLAPGWLGRRQRSFLPAFGVIEGMRLLQPSSSIQVSSKNPDRFMNRAAQIIRTGSGQPSIFNSDLIVQELVRMGKDVVDARCGGLARLCGWGEPLARKIIISPAISTCQCARVGVAQRARPAN